MKKLWKILKILLIFAAGFLILDAFVITFFSIYRPQIPKTDAIIILGAAINTPALYNRSMEGLKLYEEGKAKILVLSGGRISDEDISEAGYMDKVITKNAQGLVPVILEDQSHSTYENIKNSKALVPDATSIIVVSDKFHLARGVLFAKRAGFKKVYWAAPEPFYFTKKELAYYYMREEFAMIAYIPKFIFN